MKLGNDVLLCCFWYANLVTFLIVYLYKTYNENNVWIDFDLFDQVCCPDLASCIFVLEQAVSVRALQEMVNTTSSEQVDRRKTIFFVDSTFAFVSQSSANQGGQTTFRTLLYGHAVLLRHYHSQMVGDRFRWEKHE